jgi:SAM-dependent methyltransferase
MERYWDQRASESPFYYVDNRMRYDNVDVEAFWRGGEEAIDALLGPLGIGLNENDEVLEIGCGVGRLTRVLSARARWVHALDVSDQMLSTARLHNPALGNVRWIHGDGTTLGAFQDSSFDACISFVVFQHLPDPELTYGYVREIGRVLRPGGWAAFQVSNDPAKHRRPSGRDRVRKRLHSAFRHGPRGVSNPAWLGSAVDLEHLTLAAHDGGMELEHVENEGTQFCLVLARRAS